MKAIKPLKAILAAALCLGLEQANAQCTGAVPSCTPAWTVTYNNTINGANPDNVRAVTTYGTGVYVTGVLNKVVNSSDYYTGTFKYTSTGGTSWSNFPNGGNPSTCGGETGYDIKVDGSGNTWVAGAYYDGNAASFALWRYNTSGALVNNYPKIIGSTGCSGASIGGAYCLVISGSDVYVAGSKYLTSATSWYLVVAKDNPSGTGFTWTWDTYNNSQAGLTKQHCLHDIEVNGTGVYATGFVTNGSGNKDICTVALNAGTGALLSGWTTNPVIYSGGTGDDIASSLSLDASGFVYVAGFATIASQGKNGFLTKYSGTTGAQQSGFPVLHNRGNLDDAWTDMEIKSGTDPAVFVGGYSSTDQGNMDYALAAYTSTGGGASGWSTNPKYYDGGWTGTELAGTDQGKAIEYSTTTGRVYITGMSSETVSGGGAADVNLTTIGYSASNGSMVWGPASYDSNTDAVPGDDETYWSHSMRVYYSGCYTSDIILVTGGTLVTNQSFDYVTIQYGQGSGSCSEGPEGRMANSASQTLVPVAELHPNPFSTSAELRMDPNLEITHASLLIIDVTGRVVATISGISATNVTIDRGNLPKGLYFFKVVQENALLAHGKFTLVD